jgi:hypothetical protein
MNRLRGWFRKLERRWIPASEVRDRHEAIVRERLAEDGEPLDPEPGTDDGDATEHGPRRNLAE